MTDQQFEIMSNFEGNLASDKLFVQQIAGHAKTKTRLETIDSIEREKQELNNHYGGIQQFIL